MIWLFTIQQFEEHGNYGAMVYIVINKPIDTPFLTTGTIEAESTLQSPGIFQASTHWNSLVMIGRVPRQSHKEIMLRVHLILLLCALCGQSATCMYIINVY